MRLDKEPNLKLIAGNRRHFLDPEKGSDNHVKKEEI
jgi:hypothetical protein